MNHLLNEVSSKVTRRIKLYNSSNNPLLNVTQKATRKQFSRSQKIVKQVRTLTNKRDFSKRESSIKSTVLDILKDEVLLAETFKKFSNSEAFSKLRLGLYANYQALSKKRIPVEYDSLGEYYLSIRYHLLKETESHLNGVKTISFTDYIKGMSTGQFSNEKAYLLLRHTGDEIENSKEMFNLLKKDLVRTEEMEGMDASEHLINGIEYRKLAELTNQHGFSLSRIGFGTTNTVTPSFSHTAHGSKITKDDKSIPSNEKYFSGDAESQQAVTYNFFRTTLLRKYNEQKGFLNVAAHIQEELKLIQENKDKMILAHEASIMTGDIKKLSSSLGIGHIKTKDTFATDVQELIEQFKEDATIEQHGKLATLEGSIKDQESKLKELNVSVDQADEKLKRKRIAHLKIEEELIEEVKKQNQLESAKNFTPENIARYKKDKTSHHRDGYSSEPAHIDNNPLESVLQVIKTDTEQSDSKKSIILDSEELKEDIKEDSQGKSDKLKSKKSLSSKSSRSSKSNAKVTSSSKIVSKPKPKPAKSKKAFGSDFEADDIPTQRKKPGKKKKNNLK